MCLGRVRWPGRQAGLLRHGAGGGVGGERRRYAYPRWQLSNRVNDLETRKAMRPVWRSLRVVRDGEGI